MPARIWHSPFKIQKFANTRISKRIDRVLTIQIKNNMKEKMPSQDEMIKNLIRDYPEDSLDFFEPKILKDYGKPVKIHFHIQEVKKHRHKDRNLKNDMVVIYQFANKEKVVLALVEHWSDKAKFNIYRFCVYLVNIAEQFPDAEILPVALFTDKAKEWTKMPKDQIEIGCLDKKYLLFKYKLIRLKDHEALKYRDSKNKFISVLRAAMSYDLRDKIILGVEFIKSYSSIENDIQKVMRNIDIIEYFLLLGKKEKIAIFKIIEGGSDKPMIVQELIKSGEKKGKIEGKIEGKIQGKIEAAQNLINLGISTEIVMKATGLSKEELQKAGIIKRA